MIVLSRRTRQIQTRGQHPLVLIGLLGDVIEIHAGFCIHHRIVLPIIVPIFLTDIQGSLISSSDHNSETRNNMRQVLPSLATNHHQEIMDLRQVLPRTLTNYHRQPYANIGQMEIVYGQQCQNLHSWFRRDHCLSSAAKLQEHKEGITGIALPVGSDKFFFGSTDGTVRAWDCHTGGCTNLIKFGVKVTSLISERPWIFVGLQKSIWVAEDGVISGWRGSSEASSSSPSELVAPLTGHSKAVVWDMDTLECKMTLNGHTDVVTSLICWDNYLLSSSIDGTIKIWAATEEETLKVIYTHTEKSSGMTDTEGNHILLGSCKDNSVRLYELPSFLEKGHLFAKKEVSKLELGHEGLFFTGDETGLLTVWKWMDELKVASTVEHLL
ncbi:hypothetical protein Fmac_001701 [Flemingia macrophylla]|uniref:Uncharacterized protein n=1 Tax=Flemingia macrophylla TaxID=520843 RepID=A0ABD1NIF3_9FABA